MRVDASFGSGHWYEGGGIQRRVWLHHVPTGSAARFVDDGLFALTAHFDPLLQGASPPWVYCWCAFALWGYQLLDAMDGKQARRTGSSSPLGQLFGLPFLTQS